MSDIHALSGAYAIDALDDIERAQFERHLAECAECRAEVDSLREASAMLAETTAVEPPADLRDRLLAEIRTVRPLPPVVPAPEETPEEPEPLPAAAGNVTPLRPGRGCCAAWWPPPPSWQRSAPAPSSGSRGTTTPARRPS